MQCGSVWFVAGSTVAATVGILLGLAIAELGPRIWTDTVLSNFGY